MNILIHNMKITLQGFEDDISNPITLILEFKSQPFYETPNLLEEEGLVLAKLSIGQMFKIVCSGCQILAPFELISGQVMYSYVWTCLEKKYLGAMRLCEIHLLISEFQIRGEKATSTLNEGVLKKIKRSGWQIHT